MTPYQERAINEKDNLDLKIQNLKGFIDDLLFNAVSKIDQILLKSQLGQMEAYTDTLRKRIEAFNTEDSK